MTKSPSEMRYVSLHHHSTFSYGDGFGTPAAHVERAADLGMGVMAFTEHGNSSSHVQAEKAGKKSGIKVLFGCEFYTGPADMREKQNMRKWHLTVIAMNQKGYVNLNKLVSRSWAEGFYRWPTVTGPMLAEHAEGLVVLSGCADSLLACTLLGGKGMHTPTCRNHDHKESTCPGDPDIQGALKVISKFKSLFGDRYYLEVQQFPELDRACLINSIYEKLSKRTGVPLVASSDCHYPFPEDNDMQKILHAASRNTGTVAAAEAEWEYDIRLTFPKSDASVLERLQASGLSWKAANAAIDSTAEIAERCNVILPHTDRLRFPLPAGVGSAEELLWQWLRDGWKYRWKRNANMRKHPEEYQKRLEYETSVIVPKDFADYFLVISEGVRWAKDAVQLPVGPARGSAAASLVAYLLRITEVDPMMFPTMMFERFIDEKREDPPDIDLDFADDRRYLIREHYSELYGADRVGNIGNFQKYRGKNAVNDVARVHSIPKYEAKIVNDLVIERSGGDSRFDASLSDTRDMFPQAAGVFERWPALDYAIRLEGNYKAMGVHAAGLVISNDPINDTCATYSREVRGHRIDVIAYDKKDAEYLEMLKADFLGLSTMGMIDIALNAIGMKLDDLYQLPLDDPETIAAFTRADVKGIFQFEGRATRLMTMDVRPETFMEIADINALSRPGPLFSGASAKYVDIKHGRAEAQHLHPIVDKWAEHSKFQIIYQEQVLGILREMGGFPGSATGALRKIISLKLGEAQFNEWYGDFIAGAKKHHNVDQELADKIWRLMVTSATYSFNIAHCISYGMLAYWCMWLKVHHPMAFYTAVLQKSDTDKWPMMIRDAEAHGIEVLPPDLRYSKATWSVHPKKRAVLAGLEQVPGIAEKTAAVIEEWMPTDRTGIQWHQLSAIKGIGPKTISKIEKWVNSDDPFNLYYAQRVLGELREAIRKRAIRLPFKPTHTSDQIPRDEQDHKITWMGIPKTREYKDFMEDERARSGKEPEVILAEMDSPDLLKSCVLKCYDDGEEDVYLRFNRFRFPKFKSMLEDIKLDGSQVVIATGMKRRSFGLTMQVQSMVVIDVSDPAEDDDENV